MLIQQPQDKQSSALASYKKDSYNYITRDIQFRLRECFFGLGIRYLYFHERDNTLLISNISNGIVHLLNLSNGIFRSYNSHGSSVRKIKVFNNEIITGGWDGAVRITNYFTLKERLMLGDRYMGRCPGFHITPDGKHIYSYSYDSDFFPPGKVLTNMVRKWSLDNGKLLKSIPASKIQHTVRKGGSVISLNNRLYVCSDCGYFRIFNLQTSKLIKDIVTQHDFVSLTPMVQYNLILAYDSEGFVHFFNTIKNEIEFSVRGHASHIMCLKIHPKNQDIVVSASSDGTVKFWQMPGFSLINTVENYHRDIWSLVIFNDRLVIGNIEGEICVYDIRDLTDIQFLGRIVLAKESFVVQAMGSKKFYTNNITEMEVFNGNGETRITGKEAEYLLGESNDLNVLRELFGIEDRMNKQIGDKIKNIPQLQERFF